MSSEPPVGRRFQWKWVAITLLMYVLFYFLPLSLVPGGVLSSDNVNSWSMIFIGIWSLAGILIVAAAAGFLSEGVTIRETLVASAGVTLLGLGALTMREHSSFLANTEDLIDMAYSLVPMFILSYLGARWGETMEELVIKSKQAKKEPT
jgi:hypothetical protein